MHPFECVIAARRAGCFAFALYFFIQSLFESLNKADSNGHRLPLQRKRRHRTISSPKRPRGKNQATAFTQMGSMSGIVALKNLVWCSYSQEKQKAFHAMFLQPQM
ncbi:hypothetical protein NDU88_003127 [Pleurodeles waltl]|uniref:Uncharacterized protein n=1 Tax=Pleurodeles waltl TaxID=8319 RepID=A0AAV7VGG7_PLEWA|nr:hypothetical protein NDU88_003127 [Pleurodeles waltl]